MVQHVAYEDEIGVLRYAGVLRFRNPWLNVQIPSLITFWWMWRIISGWVSLAITFPLGKALVKRNVKSPPEPHKIHEHFAEPPESKGLHVDPAFAISPGPVVRGMSMSSTSWDDVSFVGSMPALCKGQSIGGQESFASPCVYLVGDARAIRCVTAGIRPEQDERQSKYQMLGTHHPVSSIEERISERVNISSSGGGKKSSLGSRPLVLIRNQPVVPVLRRSSTSGFQLSC